MVTKLSSTTELRARTVRVLYHALTWLLVWAALRYFSIPGLTKDNEAVVQHATFAILAQSVAIFYILGYAVFPRFLYQRRIPALMLCMLAIYQLTYISNYFEFRHLASISDGFLDEKMLYVKKIWEQYYMDSAWTSCFTSFRVAYATYAWSLFYVIPILAVKVMRDTVVLKTQNIRLERDRLQLEKNNLDLQSQSLKLQRDNLNLELSFLKAQINPHFLFNTLNAIYLRTTDLDETTADLVMRLSNLMRYSLYESNRDKVVLSRETDYIESYIQLERARFGEKVHISYHLEGNPDEYLITPLLLISFVENAFKHGTGRSAAQSYVHVSVVLDGSRMYFLVKNSIGKSVHARNSRLNEQVGGFGLMSTAKRLRLLYPEKHVLDINEGEESFEVRLEIELQQTKTVTENVGI